MSIESILSPPPSPLFEAPKEAMEAITTQVKDKLSHTKDYVRENPLPVILGALIFGVAVGCTIAFTKREEPTLRERLVDQPLSDFREAIYAALSPVADRLRDDYATARDGVERTFSGRGHKWSDQLNRVGRNLKFW